MRKLTAVCFALLITVSAVAAPSNDPGERGGPGLITRIVRKIKTVIHAFEDIQPGVPIPSNPTP